MSSVKAKRGAVLDTSFYVHCFFAGLIPYLFDDYEVYVTEGVIAEATPVMPGLPSVVLPNVKMFHLLQQLGAIKRQQPADVPSLPYGLGEREAIGLALERRYVLLIDDYEPLQYALTSGITVVTTAEFVASLNQKGIITQGMALGWLRRLHNELRDELIDAARQQLVLV